MTTVAAQEFDTNNHNYVNTYFKLGSSTRRHSVIGCIGFEYANPIPQSFQEEEEEEKYHDVIKNKEKIVNENKEEDKEEDKKEEETACCAICLEDDNQKKQKNLATTPCGHTFCLTCLLRHLKHNNSCPLCRAPIEENEDAQKKIPVPISYDDGVMLLNYELETLGIERDIEQYVQRAIEVSENPQTDGHHVSSIVDDLMVMVAQFGFNLLYDALCHMHGGEENVDPEWQYEMYEHSDDEDEDDSSLSSLDGGDDNSDNDDDGSHDDDDSDDSDDNDDDGDNSQKEEGRVVD